MTYSALFDWILFAGCILVGLIVGVNSCFTKTCPESRYYPITRITDRVLGFGVGIFSVLVIGRRWWAFYGLILFFVLMLVYWLLDFSPQLFQSELERGRSERLIFGVWVVFTCVVFGTPAVVLAFLRPVLEVR
jgi:hypothetical protein